MNSAPSLSDKIRVIVCGDSGVGKVVMFANVSCDSASQTSLVQLICSEKVATSPASTTGCNLDVKVLQLQFVVELRRMIAS